jgi:hypothetical protein
MNLRTGFSGRIGVGTGNYTPTTPAAAMSPTAPIAQQAYGISGSGTDAGNDNIAWMGSVAVGAVAALALIYLWWSLPR